MCPGQNGGKNFPAGAYSPLNNALFMPVQNLCAIMSPIADKIVPNSAYGLNVRQQMAPGADKVGTVYAVSVETGKTLWKFDNRAGRALARSHRRRLDLRRRRQRPLPRARSGYRQSFVGNQPGSPRHRLPGHLRREWKTIRSRQHRHVFSLGRSQPHGPRVEARHQQRHLRFRASLTPSANPDRSRASSAPRRSTACGADPTPRCPR